MKTRLIIRNAQKPSEFTAQEFNTFAEAKQALNKYTDDLYYNQKFVLVLRENKYIQAFKNGVELLRVYLWKVKKAEMYAE
jgi:hypothetical protein